MQIISIVFSSIIFSYIYPKVIKAVIFISELLFCDAFINISKISFHNFLGTSTLHIPAIHSAVDFLTTISGVISFQDIFFNFCFKIFI